MQEYFEDARMKDNLVDKILEQGQRLRNAMVESILKNDPLNGEIIFDKHYQTPSNSDIDLCQVNYKNALKDDKRVESYLRGDFLTRNDEVLAYEALKSMSADDLCKVTDRTFKSANNKCNCPTCKAYHSYDLNCDLRRRKTRYEQDENKDIASILKYVDCLKVVVHNLVLNEAGNKKLQSEEKSSSSETFFIEYQIPESINKNLRSRSKVNSGLDNSCVRICSRRRNNEAILFKHTSEHEIGNLKLNNLQNIVLKFQISYRASKNRNDTLGLAQFHFSSFELAKNLTCHRGLTVKLNENAPIDLGTLKVSIQLGCGKLYYGSEFLDGLNLGSNNSVVLDSDDSACQINTYDPELNTKSLFQVPDREITVSKSKSVDKIITPKKNIIKKPEFVTKPIREKVNKEAQTKQILTNKLDKSTYFSHSEISALHSSRVSSSKTEKKVIFGFLYISEAHYLCDPVSSYILCRPFCQETCCVSQIVSNNSQPIFNFHQVIPLIYDDDLLFQLRENYMVIEFVKKFNNTDSLIGFSKVSLHQFYLALRNSDILKHLEKNKLPVIGTDWWEPIFDSNDEVIGQVQVLAALGTDEQIKQLEIERGFKKDPVKARNENVFLRNNLNPQKESAQFRKSVIPSKPVEKINKATQSEKMDSNDNKNEGNETTDVLNSVLNQLLMQKDKVVTEMSTNTDPLRENTENLQKNAENATQAAQSETNANLKKTSDLLDSLERALLVPPTESSLPVSSLKNSEPETPSTFKAQIIIDSALHLPSRKKCKSKKTKNRSGKSEDNILPSTYVTFETRPNGEMKFTEIVSKSTRPKWDFTCNVDLPVELLTNSQNRLIFKVWRKSTSTVKQPNLHADIVLGFAALDLTVLLAGLPNVQGWFNIIDFSGKCNGQINIHVTPLQSLAKLKLKDNSSVVVSSPTQEDIDLEEPGELLSRALKRKFTELDEITQRLRLRLSKVTNEDSDCSNDDVADQFEHDINTLCIEEDFNLINFAEEARKINSSTSQDNNLLTLDNGDLLSAGTNSTSSQNENNLMEVVDKEKSGSSSKFESHSASTIQSEVTSLDRELNKGKQKIDSLLEKLSLISANDPTFTNRYVSGCSTSQVDNHHQIDTESILKDLDHFSRPNIEANTGSGYDPNVMLRQLYESCLDVCKSAAPSTSSSQNATSNNSSSLEASSASSLIPNLARPAPDGEGTASSNGSSKN